MYDRSMPYTTPLTGELVDGISEAVVMSPDRRGRSKAICDIVQEVCEAVAWLHGSAAPTDQEVVSLQELLAAAHAHQHRMSAS